jgi:predicted O-methyltransferase YrrM
MDIPLNRLGDIEQYIRSNFTNVPKLVLDYQAKAKAMPIPPHHITPQIGKLLQILVQLKQAKSILEIGTMWGYSTWWLMQGINEQPAKIITLEKELKHYNLAKQFFADMHLEHLVELRYCDALNELKQFEERQFDVVFLDADRREYLPMLPKIERVLQPGGLFVVDNVLWSPNWNGHTVADNSTEERVQEMQQFNTQLADSTKFTALPLALGSGIIIALKT